MRLVIRSCHRFSGTHNIKDIIDNYTPLSGCERVQELTKQAYLSATDYHKASGEHYSHLTDLLSFGAAKLMHDRMQAHPTGRRILQDKPRITDGVFEGLSVLPQGSFGKEYYDFMQGLGFRPSERPLVKYVPNLQYAYVLQRYKQVHDFIHVLLARRISVDEELLIKWFEMRQLRLPSASLASIVSPVLSRNFNLGEVARVIRVADRAEFVLNIYYEQHFAEPAADVRKKFKFD